MSLDDLKKLATGRTLFRLDAIVAPKLVPLLYAAGLAALLLWAVSHVFASFASNFGNGLWGILEIAVFGALGLVSLRIGCEALLVFFKAHENAMDSVNRTRLSSSLLEDLQEAIHDLAEGEETLSFADEDFITPATVPLPKIDEGRP